MDQKQFMSLMSELIEMAAVCGNQVDRSDVDAWFEELGLASDMMVPVYRYLEDNGVRVLDDTLVKGSSRQNREDNGKPRSDSGQSGSRRTVGNGQNTQNIAKKNTSDMENQYYKMYLSELSNVEPCTLAEIEQLLPRVLAGERAATDRLAEGNLHRIAKWACGYVGHGVVISDLIQEGNIVLLEEIYGLKAGDFSVDTEKFLSLTEKKSREAMEDAIRAQQNQKGMGEKLAQRANRIMDLTEEIAEEYGVEATAAQLAEKLHITEDEVKDIMKLSLDVISVAEARGDPGAFEPKE